MLLDERLDLADDLGMVPELELAVDPVLQRRKPQFLEPCDLRASEGLRGEIGQRSPGLGIDYKVSA